MLTRRRLSAWTESVGSRLDLKVSQCGEWFSLTSSLYWNFQSYACFHLSPLHRLTCRSPLNHDIRREVPRDFSKSNISTSMFSVHRLKLKNHILSPLEAKNNMHSKTCLHLLQSDSKHTQLPVLWFKDWARIIFHSSPQLCYGLRLPAIVCWYCI